MTDNLPYVVYGTITDSSGSNPNGAKVVLRNDRSGQKISTTTDVTGSYAFDAGNLNNGYVTSDRLSVICAYGDEEDVESFLISDNLGGKNQNLTLAAQADSSDCTYAQPQDVLDELGDKTTSDISFERVRKAILRSESEIDERTESSFGAVFVQDELYDFNQHTSYRSPEQYLYRNTDILVGSRNDHWGTSFNDKFRLNKYPLVNPITQLNGATTTTATSITVDSTSGFPSSGTIFIYNSSNGTEQITYTGKTSTTFTGCTRGVHSTTATAHANNSYVSMISLSRNSGGVYQADDWEDLEGQNGGGGDYIVNNDIAYVTFVQNLPYLGKRKIKVSYTYGRVSVPKAVERLCILLSVRDVLMSKSNSSLFDGSDSISLEGMSINPNFSQSVSYLKQINTEISELWKIIGEMSPQAV